MRALIVDDSRAARSLVRRVIEPLGFEVTEAGHGQEALDRLTPEDPVDLMLVDWNMPVMDGLEFVREIRSRREYASVSILMVSSESDPRLMARALMMGADDYLVKPLNADMMLDKLEIIGVLDGG